MGGKLTIKAIIWDVGGVLERTEKPQPRKDLAEWLGLPILELETIIFGNEDDYRIQLGQISMEEHKSHVAKKLNLSPTEIESVFTDFFAGDVLDLELIDYIRELKQKYSTAIISNYSKLLRSKINDEWKIGDAFDYIICSAEVSIMKPNPEIYQIALEQIGFPPEETIFIDDFLINIEAANNLGIHGLLFQNKKQTIIKLDTLLKNY